MLYTNSSREPLRVSSTLSIYAHYATFGHEHHFVASQDNEGIPIPRFMLLMLRLPPSSKFVSYENAYKLHATHQLAVQQVSCVPLRTSFFVLVDASFCTELAVSDGRPGVAGLGL